MKSVSRNLNLLSCIFLLLLPAWIQVAHILVDHEHFVCEHYSEEHYHEPGLDCELCEFQQASFPLIAGYSGELNIPQEVATPVQVTYEFQENHQALPFALRGPPLRF